MTNQIANNPTSLGRGHSPVRSLMFVTRHPATLRPRRTRVGWRGDLVASLRPTHPHSFRYPRRAPGLCRAPVPRRGSYLKSLPSG